MSENVKLMKYQAKDGQEISLTADLVRKYLVRGKSNLVTSQEIMFFWSICKSRGLNPQAGDCYLIKYSDDPAQIITSIGFLRSRARANKNYRGHEKGVIVLGKDGKVKRTKGLVLHDEILIGGWFEATPDGDLVPTELEVNLEGYIKKTAKGIITKFWKKENQATMIAKVAESQGLRTAWPDEFGHMYTPEEMNTEPQGPIIDITSEPIADSETENTESLIKFMSMIPDNIDKKRLEEFLVKSAESFGDTTEQLRARAIKDYDAFLNAFLKWEKMNYPEEPAAPDSSSSTEKPFSSTPGIPDLLNDKSWLRMKSGYSTFIHSNKKELLEYSKEYPEIIELMREKWERQFPNDAWPLAPKSEKIDHSVSEEDKQTGNAKMFNIPEGVKPNVHVANLIDGATTKVELEAILGDLNSLLANGLITENDHVGLQTILSAQMDSYLNVF